MCQWIRVVTVNPISMSQYTTVTFLPLDSGVSPFLVALVSYLTFLHIVLFFSRILSRDFCGSKFPLRLLFDRFLPGPSVLLLLLLPSLVLSDLFSDEVLPTVQVINSFFFSNFVGHLDHCTFSDHYSRY